MVYFRLRAGDTPATGKNTIAGRETDNGEEEFRADQEICLGEIRQEKE